MPVLLTTDDAIQFSPARTSGDLPGGATPGNGVVLPDQSFVSIFASVAPAGDGKAGFIGVIGSADRGVSLTASVRIADWFLDRGAQIGGAPG